MKLMLVLIAILGLAACYSPKVEVEDATAEFKPLVEKVNAAWMTLDPANAAPYYAKDADLTFFDVAPLQYKGWQEYADGFKKFASQLQSIQVVVNPGMKAIKRGDIAVINWTGTVTVTPKGGPPENGQIRGTEVLEKRGNDWLIVHEHVSMPMPEAPPAPEPTKPTSAKKK